MNIARRIGKLELHAPSSGGCTYCRGEDAPYVVMVVNGVEIGGPLPPRCAACSQDFDVRRIIVDGCDDEQVRLLTHLAAGPKRVA